MVRTRSSTEREIAVLFQSPNGSLDQIAVGRNRLWQSTDRVNLVYTIEIERIHAFDWNRDAVPIKRDPL